MLLAASNKATSALLDGASGPSLNKEGIDDRRK